MQQFNVFQAIYMSFYSKRLYRDVAGNWGGKAFLYLLILLTFISLYYAFSLQNIAKIAYQAFYSRIAPQTPVLTIKDGKLATPENRPYFIIDPDTHLNYVVIDTTGQYKSIEQAKSPVLITQTEVIIQKNPTETRIYTIPAGFQQTIVLQKINDKIHDFIGFLWIIFFIFSLLALYIYRILQALLYSILGKIFAVIFKVQISFGQIVQIMLVAITPVMIIEVIQDSIPLHVPHAFLLYFMLAMAYLFYGIIANKK